MTLRDAKRKVLKHYPSAWYNEDTKEVSLYTQGIRLGTGLEHEAWVMAAENIRADSSLVRQFNYA